MENNFEYNKLLFLRSLKIRQRVRKGIGAKLQILISICRFYDKTRNDVAV